MGEHKTPNWPDPARPGAPLHPEQDGWHWMLVTHGIGHAFPMLWDAGGRMWDAGDAGWTLAEDIATRWRYLGPCILPADLAAERAAAAEAMREAAADCARLLLLPDDCGPDEAHGRFQQAIATCEAIRAIPLPSASALAERDERMREEGRREAFAEAAWIAQGRESEGGEYALAAKHIAAAIRARSEGKP